MKKRHRQQIYVPVFARVLLIAVACLAFAGIVVYTNNRSKEESERLEQVAEQRKQEQQDRYSFTLSGEDVTEEDDFLISAYDVLTEEAQGEILVDSEAFYQNASVVSGYNKTSATASLDISCSIAEGEIVVLQFKAWTDEGSGWLQVYYGEDDVISLWVSETSGTFYIPISGKYDISEISFEMETADFVKTNFDEFYLVKYDDTAMTDLRIGVYSDYECETTVISAEDYALDVKASQCLAKDGYLYTLCDGTLGVYAISDSGYELVSEYSGMGDTADMAFTEDESAIVVTAKVNGVYIFDISSPDNITLASHYATLKYSNGVCVSDNYAFVSSRYYGIEVVDISDISNPVYVNMVGETAVYQDCFVSDGYLYAGAYSEKRIDIYDISDINDPSLCSQISLDGNGQGVYVSDGILYAATGRDSGDTYNSSNDLSDYGKGTGNGLEIYDVSDPKKPVHLSTSKTLGRLSYGTRDVWDVVVSDNYAYLSSRYNGLYVFDVSDPENPVCVDIYEIEAESDSSFFNEVDSETFAFPYDTDNITRGCVYHVCLQDGCLYAALPNMGIYKIEANYITEDEETDSYTYSASEKDVSIPSVKNCDVTLYLSDSCVYAVEAYEGYYYVASGDGGIDILDGNFEPVANYPTDYAVLDVKAVGGYLFTAESEGGIGIWTVSGGTLERISSYCQMDNECYSSLVVTSDGNFILAQRSSNRYARVDVTDKYNPVSAGNSNISIGNMFYRNLCSIVADGYVCAYGSSLQCWYYYDGTTLNYVSALDNNLYSEQNGMCAVGDKAVYIYSGGYCYYDPAADTTSEKVTVSGITLKGKCFSNGEMLVVVDEDGGDVTLVDVTDIDDPTYIARFSIDGIPDVGTFDGNYLLIPCRNYGLLKIDISGIA